MNKLAQIKAELAKQDQKANFSGGDNAVYPHWNIPEGSSVTLRILPDGDEDSIFFWAERQMIRLPFSGVKGDPGSKPVVVQVPCNEMWGPVNSCPVLKEVRPMFKDASLEDTAKKYWKKKSYIFQGFVEDDPMTEEDVPENPIRRFIMGPQLFQSIKDALTDPDLEEIPTDVENGLNFIVKKTKKGEWANYDTSKWARKETPLSDEQKAAIEEFGLSNLIDFLPNQPDQDHLDAIAEMFEASLDGEAYDEARWGAFYRPAGMTRPEGDSTAAPK